MEKFHYLYQIKNPRKKTDINKNKNKNNKKNTNRHVNFKCENHNENTSYRLIALKSSNTRNKNKRIDEKNIAPVDSYNSNKNITKFLNVDKSELLKINKKNTSRSIIEKKRNKI